MALSPSRRIYQGFPYTQTREDVQHGTLRSQHSPQISSPNLNAQSQYQNMKNTSSEQLKNKLETVLRHNSHLLNQNAALSQMVNGLRIDLVGKSGRQEIMLQHASRQLNETLQAMKNNQMFHQRQLERLLDQISALHSQCYQIQVSKNAQIKQLQQRHQKQLGNQSILLKKSHQQAKQFSQLQIKKLKQTIQLKDYQIDSFRIKNKNQLQQLISQNNSLKMQIKHIQQLKQIQINQIGQRNKQNINSTIKQIQRQKDIQIKYYDNTIKKLKKQIINKNIQLQQKQKNSTYSNQQTINQIISVKGQKQRLQQQLRQLQQQHANTLTNEKKRLRQLAQIEKQNIQNIKQSQIQCLRAQNYKLTTICISKNVQLKRLYTALDQSKQAFKQQTNRLENLIIELKKKLKQTQQDYFQQLQLLKIKMGQLHQSDIKSIQSYYQNQIAALLVQLRQLTQTNTVNKQKVYNLLQINDNLRKNFQIEISKQKARVQDLKVKLAAVDVQHREQITSLGTRMELTSQTLIREADQKHKSQSFFEAQKKKFYLIIESKDKQAKSLNETMQKIKQLYSQQKQLLKKQLIQLKTIINDKDIQMKNYKKTSQQQFQQKRLKIIKSMEQTPDDQLIRENQQLKKYVTQIQGQIFAKQKQLDFILKQTKSLQQQLGLKAGFIQTLQLQSQAAIEDQKSKMKILMNSNEVSLKTYFQEKIASRDRDNNALKDQLNEKEDQIRGLIIKYNALQKRLNSLMQAQDKLSQFQTKIVNLGVDQNLVKNLAELFSKYKKSS